MIIDLMHFSFAGMALCASVDEQGNMRVRHFKDKKWNKL